LVGFGFAAFFVFGVALVLIGANQEALRNDLGLDLTRSGLLVSGLALGIGVGVVASGPLVDRLPRRPLFLASALLAAVPLLGVDARMGFGCVFVLVALLGLGFGAQETLINASITESFGAAAGRPLVLAHAAVTLGAMLAPLWIGWLAEWTSWTASFRATGVAQLALMVVALGVRFPAPRHAASSGHAPLRAALSLALLPFLVASFAYVGIETTLTILAVPYASVALGLDDARGLAAISAFWLGLLAGRLAVVLLRRPLDARLLLGAGLAGALVLGGGVGAASRQVELVFAVTGLSMGLVFPVMIALTAERFPQARGTATGLVAGAGALGGFAVPWLHGAIGDREGAAVALAALAPWAMGIALAAWLVRRGERR